MTSEHHLSTASCHAYCMQIDQVSCSRNWFAPFETSSKSVWFSKQYFSSFFLFLFYFSSFCSFVFVFFFKAGTGAQQATFAFWMANVKIYILKFSQCHHKKNISDAVKQHFLCWHLHRSPVDSVVLCYFPVLCSSASPQRRRELFTQVTQASIVVTSVRIIGVIPLQKSSPAHQPFSVYQRRRTEGWEGMGGETARLPS